MTPTARIYPSRIAAEAAAGPGDYIVTAGNTWLVTATPGAVPRLTTGLTGGARATDPDTSHKAAAVNRTSHKARVLAAHLAHPDGLDDFQLARITGLKQTSCGVRRAEMTKLGWFVDTGRRGRSDTNTECVIWALTGEGRAAAERAA